MAQGPGVSMCWVGLPSLKLTVRTRVLMVGILVSFWDGLFSWAMLVSG